MRSNWFHQQAIAAYEAQAKKVKYIIKNVLGIEVTTFVDDDTRDHYSTVEARKVFMIAMVKHSEAPKTFISRYLGYASRNNIFEALRHHDEPLADDASEAYTAMVNSLRSSYKKIEPYLIKG